MRSCKHERYLSLLSFFYVQIRNIPHFVSIFDANNFQQLFKEVILDPSLPILRTAAVRVLIERVQDFFKIGISSPVSKKSVQFVPFFTLLHQLFSGINFVEIFFSARVLSTRGLKLKGANAPVEPVLTTALNILKPLIRAFK